jgi:hypothetical protein
MFRKATINIPERWAIMMNTTTVLPRPRVRERRSPAPLLRPRWQTAVHEIESASDQGAGKHALLLAAGKLADLPGGMIGQSLSPARHDPAALLRVTGDTSRACVRPHHNNFGGVHRESQSTVSRWGT